MSTTKIYAPQTGTIKRAGICPSPQCGDCPHPTCGTAYVPVDIATASGMAGMWLEVDYPTIRSVTIVQTDPCCSGSPSQWTKALTVNLYTGPGLSGTHVGWIRYGHVTAGAGVIGTHDLSSGSFYLGTVPSSNPPGCPSDPIECKNQGCCYCGQHVHMEVGANAALAPGFTCSAGATKGDRSKPVYQFTY